MHYENKKPLAAALNEVTVMIMFEDKVNFHKTFMVDTTKNSTFDFDYFTYLIPAQKALHYFPSFWDFPRKWATWFSRHKTWALFLDWFKLARKASKEIGFLYEKNQANPVDLKQYQLGHDWALDNYNLRRNQAIGGHYKAVDNKLRGPRNIMGTLGWIVILIIAVVAIISVLAFVSSNPGALHQAAQNATATPLPSFNPGGP